MLRGQQVANHFGVSDVVEVDTGCSDRTLSAIRPFEFCVAGSTRFEVRIALISLEQVATCLHQRLVVLASLQRINETLCFLVQVGSVETWRAVDWSEICHDFVFFGDHVLDRSVVTDDRSCNACRQAGSRPEVLYPLEIVSFECVLWMTSVVGPFLLAFDQKRVVLMSDPFVARAFKYPLDGLVCSGAWLWL